MSEDKQKPLPGIPAAKPVQGPTLTPKIAANLLILLQKTPLVGLEAFAFSEAYAALQVIANPPPGSAA